MHPEQFRSRLLGSTAVKSPENEGGASAPAAAPGTVVEVPSVTPGEQTPSPQAGTPPAAGAGAAAEPPSGTPAKPDWRDARIAELTHKLNAEKAKKAPAAAAPVQAQGETEAEFESRVAQRAAEMAGITKWNEDCNAVAASGKAAFGPDFDKRLGAIQSVVNAGDQVEFNAYNEFLATAMETGKPHQLLFALGENPGEVKRLMGLSPVRRAMEMAGMASKLEAAPAPSGAPKPITPIGGSNGQHYEGISPDNSEHGMKLPKADWFARREKQAAERGIQ